MAKRRAEDVRADDDALLAHLAARSRGRPPRACASIAALAAGAGLSKCQARRALSSLEAEGLLAVERRFRPDGGQAENAYRVTPAGRARLSRLAASAQDDNPAGCVSTVV